MHISCYGNVTLQLLKLKSQYSDLEEQLEGQQKEVKRLQGMSATYHLSAVSSCDFDIRFDKIMINTSNLLPWYQ